MKIQGASAGSLGTLVSSQAQPVDFLAHTQQLRADQGKVLLTGFCYPNSDAYAAVI